MILILGSRYGDLQASGLSATHEEYREARDTRPVLVFIQQGVDPEPQQDEFIREVQGWEQGHFTAGFEDPRGFVTRSSVPCTNTSSLMTQHPSTKPLRRSEMPDRTRGSARGRVWNLEELPRSSSIWRHRTRIGRPRRAETTERSRRTRRCVQPHLSRGLHLGRAALRRRTLRAPLTPRTMAPEPLPCVELKVLCSATLARAGNLAPSRTAWVAV